MKKVSYLNVNITGGFWKKKLDMISDITVDSVYNRFKETYRFDAVDCTWKEGDPNQPHVFWDSDIAKWIEGLAYSLKNKPNDKMVAVADETISKIEKNRDEHGYYNSHFLVTGQRFTERNEHELYCLGHLIEAAVAYYEATGKKALLDVVCKYTDYVERIFVKEDSAAFVTPGHPEIELALVKLYELTDEKRYLELSKFFIDKKGNNPKDKELYRGCNLYYNQDECPVRERQTADGHSVRALYLYCAMADLAYYYDDKELFAAAERCFENIVNRRMYITGATGSTCHGEAFSVDYDLPNRIAYAETCASIALALFAQRMIKLCDDTKYADIVERTIYNGILSGISMDGKSFFYVNPLEIDVDLNKVNTSTDGGERMPITQRLEVFDCSCCPPNVIRFIANIGEYVYTHTEDTLYIHQFMESDSVIDGMKITQKTDYPTTGKVEFAVSNCNKKQLKVRIPGWCDSFDLHYDGKAVTEGGYIVITPDNTDFTFDVTFDMPVKFIGTNRRVHENAGKVALMRGPVVYCLEGVDNGSDIKNIRVNPNDEFVVGDVDFLVPSILGKGYIEPLSDDLYFTVGKKIVLEEKDIKFIPYFAFANRGESDLLVWILAFGA